MHYDAPRWREVFSHQQRVRTGWCGGVEYRDVYVWRYC